ncbi:TRADD-N-associated membrane domain-containing protein [Bradyrhizobium sp. SZCCHNR3118]|uniref:TRADD-N-associated membrane domain-containing protein n=1 Tax=Bradyrhizobium sp. SZCCHNR3118 TaxID=3057468 RepID=UPI0029165C32|nr:hypothetical protein [Bradyrhizobium sp. SZCCHNR3118]
MSVLVDILAGMFLAFLAGPTSFQLALVAGFTAPFLLTAAVKKGPFQSLDVQELQQTVKKAEKAVENQPEKAQPRWDLSRAQLNLYIAGNLAQVKQIFVITVAVMAAGFAMAAWGVYRAFDGQIQVAILTAASGVITQTIGATFLLIYRLTIRQANDYVGTLERINAVGMAVAIVDQIPDEDGTAKTKARVDLVKQILVTSGRRQLDGKGVM